MSGACEQCGNRSEHTPIADAECALWTAIRDHVREHAATLDNAPAPAAVADLLAHLNSRFHDKGWAHRAVLAVLDLGWRPVVGMSLMSSQRQD